MSLVVEDRDPRQSRLAGLHVHLLRRADSVGRMLEDVGRAEEARKSMLSQLRLWRFSKLGIPHHCTCCCFGREEEEDRPWDFIEDEKKVERLEAEMEELRQLPLDSLKWQLALRMRESYETLKTTRATKAEEEKERRHARRAKQSGFQRPLHVSSHSVYSLFMINEQSHLSPFEAVGLAL